MRGSISAQQYGGERILLYKKETLSIPNSLVNFAVTTRSGYALRPKVSLFHTSLAHHDYIGRVNEGCKV